MVRFEQKKSSIERKRCTSMELIFFESWGGGLYSRGKGTVLFGGGGLNMLGNARALFKQPGRISFIQNSMFL